MSSVAAEVRLNSSGISPFTVWCVRQAQPTGKIPEHFFIFCGANGQTFQVVVRAYMHARFFTFNLGKRKITTR